MSNKLRNIFYIAFTISIVCGLLLLLPHSHVPQYEPANDVKVGSTWWGIPNGYILFNPNNDLFFKFLSIFYTLGTFQLGSFLKNNLGLKKIIQLDNSSAIKIDQVAYTLTNYIFGYFGFVVINRLVTLIPSVKISGSILIIFLFTLNFHLIKSIFKSGNFFETINKNILEIGTGILLLLLFILMQIQFFGSHIGGDAAEYIIHELNNLLNIDSSFNLVPLYHQHYDEILYSSFYPQILSIFGHNFFNALEILWINYALAKLSILCALYICIRQYCKIGNSILISTMAYFGPFLLDPFFPTVLRIDSGIPLRLSLHSTRVVSALYPTCLGLLSLKQWDLKKSKTGRLKQKNKQEKIKEILSFVIIGISSTSIAISSVVNVTMTLLFITTAISIYTLFKYENKNNLVKIIKLLPFILNILTFFGYLYRDLTNSWLPLLILFLTNISSLILINIFLFIKDKSFAEEFLNSVFTYVKGKIIYLITGLTFGFLFLGNTIYQKLGSPTNLILNNPNSKRESLVSIKVGLGFHNFCGQHPIMHCTSIKHFANLYAVPMIVGCLSIFVIYLISKKYFSINTELLIPLVISSSLIFLISLGLYEFSSGDLNLTEEDKYSLWVKTRFIEPWFYMLVTTSLIIILNTFNTITLFLSRVFCGVTLLAPLFYNPQHGLPAEILKNLEYLIRNYW